MEVKTCSQIIRVSSIRDKTTLVSRDSIKGHRTTTTEADISRMIEEAIEVETSLEIVVIATEVEDLEAATIIKITISSMAEAAEEEICTARALEITPMEEVVGAIKEEATIEAEAAEAASAEAEEIDRIITEIN